MAQKKGALPTLPLPYVPKRIRTVNQWFYQTLKGIALTSQCKMGFRRTEACLQGSSCPCDLWQSLLHQWSSVKRELLKFEDSTQEPPIELKRILASLYVLTRSRNKYPATFKFKFSCMKS